MKTVLAYKIFWMKMPVDPKLYMSQNVLNYYLGDMGNNLFDDCMFDSIEYDLRNGYAVYPFERSLLLKEVDEGIDVFYGVNSSISLRGIISETVSLLEKCILVMSDEICLICQGKTVYYKINESENIVVVCHSCGACQTANLEISKITIPTSDDLLRAGII